MNIAKYLIENHGYLDKVNLAELGREFPNTVVIIKWRNSIRTWHKAIDAPTEIAKKELLGDCAREVFISSSSLDKLCEVFGESKS